jgi:hypothetical protein
MRRPHSFVTATRRNAMHITRYIPYKGGTPVNSPHAWLGLKRKSLCCAKTLRMV